MVTVCRSAAALSEHTLTDGYWLWRVGPTLSTGGGYLPLVPLPRRERHGDPQATIAKCTKNAPILAIAPMRRVPPKRRTLGLFARAEVKANMTPQASRI